MLRGTRGSSFEAEHFGSAQVVPEAEEMASVRVYGNATMSFLMASIISERVKAKVPSKHIEVYIRREG